MSLRQDAVEQTLNQISEAVPVEWDRLIGDLEAMQVYGWIPRPCPVCEVEAKVTPAVDCYACDNDRVDRKGRADFVVVELKPLERDGQVGMLVSYATSSAEHSKAIAQAIWGEQADELHVDCRRVEDVLPGVKAAIELGG